MHLMLREFEEARIETFHKSKSTTRHWFVAMHISIKTNQHGFAITNVVNHYNTQFNLGLSQQDKLDSVENLKSLRERKSEGKVKPRLER
jgi:predicted methyltransferase